jgi:hypothetical protein
MAKDMGSGREVKKAMPVEGTEYDKFFGTSVPHDSVVPKVPQDKSAKQASNYNHFFGASVCVSEAHPEDLTTSARATSFDSGARGHGLRVRMPFGTTILRRAVVIFGYQAHNRQAALQVVENISAMRVFDHITLVGPSKLECGEIGFLLPDDETSISCPAGQFKSSNGTLTSNVVVDLDLLTAQQLHNFSREGHDIAFCLLGHAAEELKYSNPAFASTKVQVLTHAIIQEYKY